MVGLVDVLVWVLDVLPRDVGWVNVMTRWSR
jgi:hypothetical protein